MEKRGFKFNIGILALIVLGIIILLALILFFTGSFEKFTSAFYKDVNSTKQACSNTCSDKEVYDYCCKVREIIFEEGKEPESMTCYYKEIQPDNCDIACIANKETCREVICEGEHEVRNLEGKSQEEVCGKDKTAKEKKLRGNLLAIKKTEVCCKK